MKKGFFRHFVYFVELLYLCKKLTAMQKDKYLIQSTKYTTIRNDAGIYAQRLLVLLAEAMQYRFENADLRNGIIPYSEKQLDWTFKIADLNIGNTNNISFVKEQLTKAMHLIVKMQNKDTWQISVLFTSIGLRTEDGEVDVRINDDMWEIFVEISKGFKKYQLKTAMQFSSAHALRLYQLLSGNKEPITYPIENLKKIFAIEKRYNKATDFVNRCIAKPIEEINEKAEFSVTYTPIYKSYGKGRPRIDAIQFTNHRKASTGSNNKEIVRKYGLSMLPDALKIKLMESYDFTKQGIKANAQLLQEAYTLMEEPTLMEFLDTKRAKAMKAKNPQGWIINAIAGELETLR